MLFRCGVAISAALFGGFAQAEVVTDGSLGERLVLDGPDFHITDTLGERHGNNLFHSFQTFNLNAEEKALFTGPSNITNIIGRITSGELSQIDGTIEVQIPTADLYLINPFGFVFGANAQLNVSGAFHAGAAAAIAFEDGSRFDALNLENSHLTSATPAAFGFLEPLADISLENASLSANQLTFDGANLTFDNTTLHTAGGELRLNASNAINISNSRLDTSGDGGGRIFIRAGELFAENSLLESRTHGTTDGQNIDINIGRSAIFDSSVVSSLVGFGASGTGGDINLQADSLILRNRGAIQSGSLAGGDAGDIRVQANQIQLQAQGNLNSAAIGDGRGGEITVNTAELTLDNGAIIAGSVGNGDSGSIRIDSAQTSLNALSLISTSATRSAGGDITVNASNQLTLHDNSGITAQATGNLAQAGDAGEITITTPNLTLTENSALETAAVNTGGGDIRLNVSNILRLENSQISAMASGDAMDDNGGNVQIDGPRLVLLDNSDVRASAVAGRGGDIRITADQFVATVDSVMDASSQLNVSGQIVVNADATQLAEDLQALLTGYLSERAAVAQACASMAGDAVGSLTTQAGSVEPSAEALAVFRQLDTARQHNQDKALALTRQAMFAAQSLADLEPAYRAHHQLGQLLEANGETQAAVQQYRRAQTLLERFRPVMLKRYPDGDSFQKHVATGYFDLTDTLLKQAAKAPNNTHQQSLLREARRVIEAFKATELENYFHDECLVALEQNQSALEHVMPADTAVLYPIVLPDRVELLLSVAGNIHQFSVPGAREDLYSQTNRFLRTFSRRGGQRLYRWLIAPVDNLLQQHNISTLIVAPHGPLLGLPFAALNNGGQYLVERYAVAISPGLTLTNATPLPRSNLKVLLGGVTVFPAQLASNSASLRSGFAPLPQVGRELEAIHQLFGGKLLRDQAFALDSVKTALTDEAYQIVHFATHGEFHAEANQSYVLAYDEKMTMPQLEAWIRQGRFRRNPLELLTLSACHTARGSDPRAALGLAGITVQAGAKSALAGLWAVDDAATAVLMPKFYEFLRNPELTKAQALQKAQQSLLADSNWQHPGFWAAFVLIGNWL